ncbi:SH3 domain-containing protein [Sphingobacterium tabacisoli]|uniref:SH3 domain-containing protein n=1 Tax=Sphingobacterium tabacisoli TaxID=2044855 RepID=A0ABW5L2B7_9SPHI|nr:SH3 domain-containing protein [Sphingobacterium tabacisoli]
MIRILLLVGLLSGVLSAEAQFMKVLDPDGFVNIREEPNVKSKIVGKVNSHAVVYHLEADGMSGNWVSVTFRVNDKELDGYIHASRLKVLSQLASVPLVASDQTHWLFKSPKGKGTTADVSVRVEFDNANPNALKGKLKMDENGDIALNGVPVWGLYDPNVKASRYKSIEVEIGGRKTGVPAKELETLFSVGEDLQHGSRFPMLITYDKERDALYIGASNGDTSYAYDVLFVFVAGKFKERLVYIPF